MTEFKYKGFTLTPTLNFGATDYQGSWGRIPMRRTMAPAFCAPAVLPWSPVPSPIPTTRFQRTGILRHDVNFSADLRFPTLEKIYTPPKWLHAGAKLKHVIEAEATYEDISGIQNWNRIIHFDSTDLLADTNQLKLSLTNRIYQKDSKGKISEVFTWNLAQERYFDPTFGGAVQPYQRNVIFESDEFTPVCFSERPALIFAYRFDHALDAGALSFD